MMIGRFLVVNFLDRGEGERLIAGEIGIIRLVIRREDDAFTLCGVTCRTYFGERNLYGVFSFGSTDDRHGVRVLIWFCKLTLITRKYVEVHARLIKVANIPQKHRSL